MCREGIQGDSGCLNRVYKENLKCISCYKKKYYDDILDFQRTYVLVVGTTCAQLRHQFDIFGV